MIKFIFGVFLCFQLTFLYAQNTLEDLKINLLQQKEEADQLSKLKNYKQAISIYDLIIPDLKKIALEGKGNNQFIRIYFGTLYEIESAYLKSSNLDKSKQAMSKLENEYELSHFKTNYWVKFYYSQGLSDIAKKSFEMDSVGLSINYYRKLISYYSANNEYYSLFYNSAIFQLSEVFRLSGRSREAPGCLLEMTNLFTVNIKTDTLQAYFHFKELEKIADLYLESNDQKNALIINKRIIKDVESIGYQHKKTISGIYDKALEAIGEISLKNGESTQAIQDYERLFKSYLERKGALHLSTYVALSDLVEICLEKKKFKEAIGYLKVPLKGLNGSLISDPEKADLYYLYLKNLATTYEDCNYIDSARMIYQRIISEIELSKLKDHPEVKEIYIETQSYIGHMEQSNSNFEKAAVQYQQMAETKSLKLDDDYFETRYDQLINLMASQRYFAAKRVAHDCIKKMELVNSKNEVLNIGFRENLYTLHQILKEYDSCALVVNDLVKINPTFNYDERLAAVYYFQGNYNRAKELYEKAFRTLKDSTSYFNIVIMLGQINRELKDYDQALKYNELNLTYCLKKFKDYPLTIANAYYTMGYTQYLKKNYEAAEKYLILAIAPFVIDEKTNPSVGYSYLALTDCYIRMGQFAKADQFIDKAIKVFGNSIFNDILYYSEDGRNDYMVSVNEITNTLYYYNSVRFNTNPGISAISYNYTLQLKELLLNTIKTIRKNTINTQNQDYQDLYSKWTSAKQQLTAINLDANKDSLVDLARAYEKELITKTRTDLIKDDFSQKTNWVKIRDSLQPDECAIEFINYSPFNTNDDETEYAALLIRKGMANPQFISLFRGDKVKKLLDTGDENNDSLKTKKIYVERGQELYSLIWAPLEKNLTGVKKIYFAPVGMLNLLSFAALPCTRTQLLAQKYELVQLGNTKNIPDIKVPLNFRSAIVFGDMDYSARAFQVNREKEEARNIIAEASSEGNRGGLFRRLPGTRTEIEELEKIMQKNGLTTRTHYRNDASEEAFLNSVTYKNDIIHIASHAFYLNRTNLLQPTVTNFFGMTYFQQNNDPMNRTGIVFSGANYFWEKGERYKTKADEILTANEISNLDLSGTKLVVLSACETGLGENKSIEGVYGLQRAFKLAGASRLLLSLWKVDDRTTQEYMSLFYNALLSNKYSLEKAYNLTQKTMKQRYENPYYWAAFVLIN